MLDSEREIGVLDEPKKPIKFKQDFQTRQKISITWKYSWYNLSDEI